MPLDLIAGEHFFTISGGLSVEGGLADGYWFWLEPDVLAGFGLVCYVVILTTTSSENGFRNIRSWLGRLWSLEWSSCYQC
jgi:hypothetical protein